MEVLILVYSFSGARASNIPVTCINMPKKKNKCAPGIITAFGEAKSMRCFVVSFVVSRKSLSG
jgi:hypothetical protein